MTGRVADLPASRYNEKISSAPAKKEDTEACPAYNMRRGQGSFFLPMRFCIDRVFRHGQETTRRDAAARSPGPRGRPRKPSRRRRKASPRRSRARPRPRRRAGRRRQAAARARKGPKPEEPKPAAPKPVARSCFGRGQEKETCGRGPEARQETAQPVEKCRPAHRKRRPRADRQGCHRTQAGQARQVRRDG